MIVLAVEITDLIFALDSIPAVLAVTRQPFIAYTSNIFAILGLRSSVLRALELPGSLQIIALRIGRDSCLCRVEDADGGVDYGARRNFSGDHSPDSRDFHCAVAEDAAETSGQQKALSYRRTRPSPLRWMTECLRNFSSSR